MDKWTSGGTNFFCSRSSPLCHDAILCGLWYPDSPESTGIGACASAAPSRLPGSIIGYCRRICHRKGTTYTVQARNRRVKLFRGSKCFNEIQNEAGKDVLIYKAARIGTQLIFFPNFVFCLSESSWASARPMWGVSRTMVPIRISSHDTSHHHLQ